MKKCIDCKYHLQLEGDPGLWYRHRCTKVPEYDTSAVNGEVTKAYKFCRDVNADGNCKLFSPKETQKMSNKKPEDLKIGCTKLHCRDDDGEAAYLISENRNLSFDKDQAKQAIRWLQQFVDYEEPKWVPKPGDAYRIAGLDHIYRRVNYQHPEFEVLKAYAWTSYNVQSGTLSWTNGESDYEPVELVEKKK